MLPVIASCYFANPHQVTPNKAKGTSLVLVSTEVELEVFPDSALLDCSINAQLLQVMCKGAMDTPRAPLGVKEVFAPLTSVVFWQDSLQVSRQT